MAARAIAREAEPTTDERPAPPAAATPAAMPMTAQRVLALQRTVGNAATSRVLARDPEADRVKKLNEDYDAAVKSADWKEAAKFLNGFNREDILKRLAARTPDEIAALHQGALDHPGVGPQSQLALLTPPLLTSFARCFRAASEHCRKSTEGMKLIGEAEAAKVKFGGYAEDGPAKDAWPYTVGDTVYVPKAHTDPIVAMSDFLFELNNAIRKPQFADIYKKAAEGKIDAKQYAQQKVEQEVEGMLRMGKVWFETKRELGGGKGLDKYDGDYYLQEYQAVQGGKKSKDDVVKDVLKRVYTGGADAGKTVEQFYMEQFNAHYAKPVK